MSVNNCAAMDDNVASREAVHDSTELHRRERALAVARVLLSITGLIAIYLDPTEPTRFARLAYALLVVYVGSSIAILLFLRQRRAISPRIPMVIHGVSLVWAAVISLFTSGPSSAFFVFFIFVILAAAYRWRMRESFITTVILVFVLIAQAVMFSVPRLAAFLGSELDLNRLIMRGGYLLIMGFFAGFLGEKEKQFSSEIAVINNIISQITVERSVEANFDILVSAIRRHFRANSVLLLLHEIADDRYHLLKEHASSRSRREVSQQEGRALFISPQCRREQATPEKTDSSQSPEHAFPAELIYAGDETVCDAADAIAARKFLVADALAGDDWHVRVCVVRPRYDFDYKDSSQFLQRMLTQVVPTIHNVFLVKRIREQVGAFERARIARELHDGPIQSLNSVRLQLGVLQSKLACTPEIQQDLKRVNDIVSDEVRLLRDLIQNIRASGVNADELVPAIMDLAERFERETGIGVRVTGAPDDIHLPPSTCSELLRIVQEVLVNVRRHSGAETVLISLTRRDRAWCLMIDDDGCGFPFEGLMSWSELQDSRKGPVVIKERVRLLGGEMSIDSHPGSGSKLEINIPSEQPVQCD